MATVSGPTIARCLMVTKQAEGEQTTREFRTFEPGALKQGSVRIRVQYSSLNYKDALCASGHPGVARSLPIIPGIDAAGTVVESRAEAFKASDRVMVFHARFGTEVNGAWSEWIDVPADWVYAIPESMSARQAMILGTAGFTAAHSVDQLQKHEVTPDKGEIVVTGATGGVGVCAVKLLSRLGFSVVAVTGKQDKTEWLKMLGASLVVGREALNDTSDRPLLKGRWAGAIDTVGGNTLATILRSTQPTGCVTACGLTSGVELNVTVYPFILRGVTLQGIDSAGVTPDYRQSIWQRLATDYSIAGLDDIADEVDLAGLEPKITQILAGQIAGRVIVKIADE